MKSTEVRGSRGIIATGHTLATSDGLAVLRDGGNAIDAAVAAAATLSIVAPHECGLGGDLFAIVYDAQRREVHALNASGRSPSAATWERYREGIPEVGALSISVPGMVGGWTEMLKRFGTRPLPLLLEAAVAHAENGFEVSSVLVRNVGERINSISANAGCSSMFLPSGAPVRPGNILRQPDIRLSGKSPCRRAFAARKCSLVLQIPGGPRSFCSWC